MSTRPVAPAPAGAGGDAPPSRTRPRGDLLAALPALLAAALAAATAGAVSLRPADDVANAYARRARRAFAAGDHDTAKVCFARLATAPGDHPEALFGLAATLEAVGETRRARGLLNRLAPADRPGYPRAHLRLARAELEGGRGPAAAERHLRLALAADPGAAEPNALLGQLLASSGRPELALAPLARAAEARPETRIDLARVYRALDRPDLARLQAGLVVKEARAREEAEPDDMANRLRWSEAASFLEDYEAAAGVLQRGLDRTRDPRYRSALAVVHAAWSDALARGPRPDPAGSLSLLERGLRYDPANAALLQRLARWLRAGGAEAERSRAALQALLASGRDNAGAHSALGVDAWLRGEKAAARVHLELSARLDPNSAGVANNLAWVLAHETPPDLTRALALADLALDRRPGFPQFLGTRGVVLAGLGRWKDALPDMEAALAADPDNAELHRTLADAYDRLGLPETAAAHRKAVPAPAARRE